MTHPSEDRSRTDPSKTERAILDDAEMARVVRRMAGELLEREPDLASLMLLGIRTRGLPLAERIADEVERMEGVRLEIGALDITLYRDDLSTIGPQPVVRGSELQSPVEGRVVVLCDDVLFTGRTIRAALDEVGDYGRPKAVRLAVLVDRGHRELPIHADIVGKTIETDRDELVEVAFREIDDGEWVRVLQGRGGA